MIYCEVVLVSFTVLGYEVVIGIGVNLAADFIAYRDVLQFDLLLK